jgi:ferritin
MLSKKLVDAINDQIVFELYSGYIYLSMAAYCAEEDLDGFVNFFKAQADEEKFHAMKLFDYVIERNERVELKAFDNPPVDFNSVLDVFKEAYAHEQLVTKRIYNLMDIAIEENEHATISFLKWFIDEQVEEESTFNGLIKKLERIGNDPTGLLNLDAELATRTFTPPTNE